MASVLAVVCLWPHAVALAQPSSSASTRALTIRAEMASVLLQSKRYDEAAREYSTLVALDPANRAYRLGLARSLAWGQRFRDAEAQLLVLSKRYPGDPTIESLLGTVRSGINPGSSEAAAWLAGRPESPTYRRTLARALAREGRATESLAQYDTLLRTRPSPELYMERASVHLERRDLAGAERDLNSSIGMSATPQAFMLLGDIHRWRGNLSAAHDAYVRARVRKPDAPGIAAAFARLARDQRPVVAYIPDVDEPQGWETANSTTADDLGVSYTTLSVRRGLRPRNGFDVSAGVRALRLADRDPEFGGGEEGIGADVAVSRETARKQFYARARVRAGFTYHPSTELAPEGTFALAAFANAWGLGAEISTGPAYPSLLTLASMLPLQRSGTQLREQSSSISLAGPLAKADVALRYQSSSLSDQNTRVGVQGYVRVPHDRPVALVYSANTLSYARISPLYWSPRSYVAHAAGPELARRKLRGWSFVARVLPGMAWTTQLDTATGEMVTRSGSQLAGGLETVYRTVKWEIGGAVSYGQARAGEYRRFDALVSARYLP